MPTLASPASGPGPGPVADASGVVASTVTVGPDSGGVAVISLPPGNVLTMITLTAMTPFRRLVAFLVDEAPGPEVIADLTKIANDATPFDMAAEVRGLFAVLLCSCLMWSGPAACVLGKGLCGA